MNILKEISQINERLKAIEAYLSEKHKPAKNGFTILLDAGHGGYCQNRGYLTAPAKMFSHNTPHKFHQNTLAEKASNVFYEGVYNRELANIVEGKLIEAGFDVLRVHDILEDTPLAQRTKLANEFARTNKCILVSLHANAFNSKARGFCVITSPGETGSDHVAKSILEASKGNIDIPIRYSGTGELEGDFEARFWMLIQTSCLSILIETGFFDNLEDALYLDSNKGFDQISTAIVNGLSNYIYTLNK